MALVLVLGALALLSFLVLALLTLTRNENRSARSSADILDARTLADMPAQLVISQLRRATSNLGAGFTWTSQPGVIRVFGNTIAEKQTRATLYEAYKLYSSDRMTETGGGFRVTQELERLAEWVSAPAVFTDLNSPIPLRPIEKAAGETSAAASEPRLVYPIIDPSAEGLVAGFAIDEENAPGATDEYRAPMPTMWLYVLKDGRVVAPTGGDIVATLGTTEASATNPVVARIAFWTDDESCKLNVNTASEPAPWDVPRGNTKTDHGYAEHQPARNEFHRQPGHPAYTAVSPVTRAFGKESQDDGAASKVTNAFQPVPDPDGVSTPGEFRPASDNDAEKFRDYVEANHRLLPRTLDHRDNTNRDSSSNHGTQTPEEEVRLKGERLFSTVDELLFDSDRLAQDASGEGLQGDLKITQDDVRRARFFLTTRSAAPETNLFNRPKISLWPAQDDLDLRSRTDKRMCFAATYDEHPYYFQRASVWQSDANPGAAQSRSEDGSLRRNAELTGYLQTLTEAAVPGYGGSFEEKYGERNCDQLIVSMFDMLRWGVNVENQDRDEGEEFRYLAPSVQGTNIGEHSAVPMLLSGKSGDVRGFGRFPTITEVAVVFVATKAHEENGAILNADSKAEYADKADELRAFLIVEPFHAVPGYPAVSPAVRYRIKGLEEWKINVDGTEMKLFDEGYANTNRCVSSGKGDTRVVEGMTGFNGLASQFLNKDGRQKSLGGGDETSGFPFVSKALSMEKGLAATGEGGAVKTMTFKAKPITIEILSALGDADKADVIQTLRVPFPESSEIPVPWYPMNVPGSSQDIASRFELQRQKNGEARQKLIVDGDVVRSVEAEPNDQWRGDLRLLSVTGLGNASADDAELVAYEGTGEEGGTDKKWLWFFPKLETVKQRFEDERRAVHSLRSGAYLTSQFDVFDKDGARTTMSSDDVSSELLAGFSSPPDLMPATPLGINKGALNLDARPGDWNNGPGLIEDGPYISKPDLGNLDTERLATLAGGAGGYFLRGGDFFSDEESVTLAPHRQISSAIAFGSLPTGVFPKGEKTDPPRPWQTLLFCANPLSRYTEAGAELDPKDHFALATAPPDHALLENFWMPVMEPRPLSANFATEGKVNLNHQLVPFSYIQRATALHGALQGVRITALHKTSERSADPTKVSALQHRYAVNATETVKGFNALRFNLGDVFRSPSEICEMMLVPKRFGESEGDGDATQSSSHDYGAATPTTGLSHDKVIAWWNGSAGGMDAFEVTGDNTREAPYAQLYPRLCTRSNVYQVHYRVQVLRKSRSTKPNEWDEIKDKIVSEQRGSAVIERYLDLKDSEIPDFATVSNADKALDDYYRYRIVSRQPFTP